MHQLKRINESNLAWLARGTAIAFLIRVTGVGISFIIQPILARWMGATEYGVYALAVSWTTPLAMIAGLGFPMALLRFLPEYRSKGEWGRFRGFVIGSRRATVGVSTAMALIGTVLTLWMRSGPVRSIFPTLLGLWMLPALSLVTLSAETARAMGKIGLAIAPQTVVRPLLLLAAAAAYVRFHGDLNGSVVVLMALSSLFLVNGMQRTLIKLPPKTLNGEPPVYNFREWLKVSLPLLTASLFASAMSESGIMLLGTFATTRDVGLFNVASKTASLVSFGLDAVTVISAPMFATLHASNDRRGLQRLFTNTTHLILWPSVACSLLLIIFAQPILALFGPEFVAARWELSFLAVGQMVNAGTGAVAQILSVTGYHKQSARVHGWFALINVVLNVIGIKLWGSMGAALAMATSQALLNIWLYRLVVRNLGLRLFPSLSAT